MTDAPATAYDPDACTFVQDHLGALALGSLDSVDREAMERHLRRCTACRAEAETYDDLASLFPLLQPIDATAVRPELKASLLARIERDDGELPSATAKAPSAPDSPSASVRESRREPVWLPAVSAALIAPLAISLLVLGAWANGLRNDLDHAQQALVAPPTMNIVAEDETPMRLYDVQRLAATVSGGGQLGLSESQLMGMVVAWDFDPEKEHEVWGVDHRGVHMKVCDLHVDESGAVMQTFALPEKPSSLQHIYIREKSGETVYVANPKYRIRPDGDEPGVP